jgi:hypothetical protein
MNQGTPGRDAHGRLVKGHRLGGRPRGKRSPSAISQALEAAGKNVDGARKTLVENTIAALNAEEPSERSAARRLLASLLFPRTRPLDPGLFRGARTTEELFASIAGAMAAGHVSPTEAIEAGKVVTALAESGEWERLRELHEAALQDGRITPASADAGPGTEE